MRHERVRVVRTLTRAPFVLGVDRGRDHGETVGKIRTDAEHGHRLEGRVFVLLGRRTGECFRSWVEWVLCGRSMAGRGRVWGRGFGVPDLREIVLLRSLLFVLGRWSGWHQGSRFGCFIRIGTQFLRARGLSGRDGGSIEGTAFAGETLRFLIGRGVLIRLGRGAAWDDHFVDGIRESCGEDGLEDDEDDLKYG